ncbi:hypothetical protein GGTG_07276 [Gaeumannomyces tritici R3-111a-1]|uniref:Rhodopsin domain-containing protein n=1 Tax=Gaeumannomyces tritici (strain R3-111a-1) TaxID=644352 RepID=J3P179_GAET3|nr:hypothetical protein GGTG_07276 [Gaeumannomyces tritici R3-111a-1]EJT77364.1 hypothetical protein GGTG_07276 [Gaeumannomyces tritici R3-111a-1]
MAQSSETASTAPLPSATATAPPPFHIYVPGERPNENRGPEIIATVASLTAMAWAFVSLRLFVRLKFVRFVGTDDYYMVLAAAVLTAMAGVIFVEASNGQGRHIEYIAPDDYKLATKMNFISQPLSLTALTLARLSICHLLLRFAPSKGYRWFLWFQIVLNMVVCTVFSLQTLLQCQPMEFIWNKDLPGGGYCMPPSALVIGGMINSSLTVVSDFALAVLPIPMLWNVQMNWRVKASIIAILSLGFFTVGAAIKKTIALTKWGERGDFMWDTVDITIWYTAEIAVAIIGGSIPCLKPLFTRILASTTRYGTGGSSGKPPHPNYSGARASHFYGARASRHLGGGGGGGGTGRKSMPGTATATTAGSDPEASYALGMYKKNTYSSDRTRAGSGRGDEASVEGGFFPDGVSVSAPGSVLDAAPGEGRPSDERDIMQRSREYTRPPLGITRTTDVTVSVEEAHEKGVQYMV